jgi:hypothetical protein
VLVDYPAARARMTAPNMRAAQTAIDAAWRNKFYIGSFGMHSIILHGLFPPQMLTNYQL